jgi:NAD(P)-dependent dehydrogenase (short-subunit alcohol dehydrogenase family)
MDSPGDGMDANDLFSLRNVTALVTGASGGLGQHFARTLVGAGAKVALVGRRIAPLAELSEELNRSGAQTAAVPFDSTDAEAVAGGFAAAERALGTVTLLINNSGVTSTEPLIDTEEKTWDSILDTNLKGAWLCSRVFARRLIEVGNPGAIVNVASILGLRVAGQVAAYSASKAALLHLTRSLALELARHRIRANALAPGYISTELNRKFLETPAGQALIKRVPQRRLGDLSDLDGPLLLLASEASRFMTGAVIPVDGGHLVSSL